MVSLRGDVHTIVGRICSYIEISTKKHTWREGRSYRFVLSRHISAPVSAGERKLLEAAYSSILSRNREKTISSISFGENRGIFG